MSTIKVDTIATRTGSGNITASNTIAGTSATLSGTLGVTGATTTANITTGNTSIITAGRFISSQTSNDPWFKGVNSSNSETLFIKKDGQIYSAFGLSVGGTGAANTLDDYEEGSFTPTVAGLSLTAATGHYVKVGKVVHFGFSIQVPSNSASTHFKINNPPFTPFSPGGAGNNFGGSLNFSNANVASLGITCIVTTGNDIQFYKNGAAFATHADFSNGTMVASGAYLTDA